MVSSISFPFERGQWYTIGQLRGFHNEVIDARKQDSALSQKIRGLEFPWAKLYCEEQLPVMFFANKNCLPGSDEFRAMPDGSPADVELRSSGTVTRIQVTMAYPEWEASSYKGRPEGFIQSLERAGTNQGIPVFGGGRIHKQTNGQITSEPWARSPVINRQAWQAGIGQALKRKLAKAHIYAGSIDILLVYAGNLRFNTIYERTEDVVFPAIDAAVQGLDENPFAKVVVLDYDPAGYVEYTDFMRSQSLHLMALKP